MTIKAVSINQIDLTRIGNILIYFAKNTENCGLVKANKLLYYLDCYHLEKHGRTVTREQYLKLPDGPVPHNTYHRLDAISKISEFSKDFDEFLSNFIDVKMNTIHSKYPLMKLIPKKEFEPKWFSRSEREIMEDVAKKFNKSTARELSDKTHEELPYIEADTLEKVDLKLFVKDKLSESQISEIEYIENTTKAMELNYK